MSIVVLAAAKGSPGTTTTALALTATWPLATETAPRIGSGKRRGKRPGKASGKGSGREPDGAARVCLVDADLGGSGIAAGYLRGAVPDGGGLVGYAIAKGPAGGAVPQTVALDDSGRRAVLLGITSPVQSGSVAPVLRTAVDALAQRGDVLVDLGRLTSTRDHDGVDAVLDIADVAVVVCRSTLASVSSARHLAAWWQLRTRGPSSRLCLGILVVGPGRPYPTRDVAKAVGLDVVADLAWDPLSAAVFADGAPPRWRFTQSPLLRSARAAGADLRRLAATASSSPVVPHGWAAPTSMPAALSELAARVRHG